MLVIVEPAVRCVLRKTTLERGEHWDGLVRLVMILEETKSSLEEHEIRRTVSLQLETF